MLDNIIRSNDVWMKSVSRNLRHNVQCTSHGDINALTVFDVDRPWTSGQREAPRCGGRHAEPALVGDGVDEHGHGIVGVGVELDDAGGEGGRGSGGVEADAEESEERERARVTFI